MQLLIAAAAVVPSLITFADAGAVPTIKVRDLDGFTISLERTSFANQATESENWCGAVQEQPSSGQMLTVEGSWTIPSVSIPSGESSSTEYYLYQWVGIDGVSCDVILQAGTGCTVSFRSITPSGQVSELVLIRCKDKPMLWLC